MKPITIASDADARTISLSVIAPTPLLITLTETSSTLTLVKAFLTASSVPLTSVFKTTLISLAPSLILLKISSKETAEPALSFLSFSFSFLFSAIALASFSFE